MGIDKIKKEKSLVGRIHVERIVSLLLARCYYPVSPQTLSEGAQLVNGQWYMPRWGCDTLQHYLDGFVDESVI